MNESELAAAPQNQILAQAGKMNPTHRNREQQLGDIITVRNRIHGVSRHTIESEFGGDRFAIQIDGRACKRT